MNNKRKDWLYKYKSDKIFKRDNFKCFYCGIKLITNDELYERADKLQLKKWEKIKNKYKINPLLTWNFIENIQKSKDYKRRQATIDHKIPLCLGGSNNEDNLVACCRECNIKKNKALYFRDKK